MKPTTFLFLTILALPAVAAPAPVPAPRNGWKCDVSKDMLTVYQWLKDPVLETGLRFGGDANPVYHSTDPAFKYAILPQNQSLSFTVQVGSKFKLVDAQGRYIYLPGLTVEIASNGKTVGAKTAGLRDTSISFSQAEAMPIAGLFHDPKQTPIEIRFKNKAGKALATYRFPTAGFLDAIKAGAAAHPTAPSGLGKAC